MADTPKPALDRRHTGNKTRGGDCSACLRPWAEPADYPPCEPSRALPAQHPGGDACKSASDVTAEVLRADLFDVRDRLSATRKDLARTRRELKARDKRIAQLKEALTMKRRDDAVWDQLEAIARSLLETSKRVDSAKQDEVSRMREALEQACQDFEDLLLVATKDEDAEGFITAYHFKTGAIHRMLGRVRQRYNAPLAYGAAAPSPGTAPPEEPNVMGAGLFLRQPPPFAGFAGRVARNLEDLPDLCGRECSKESCREACVYPAGHGGYCSCRGLPLVHHE